MLWKRNHERRRAFLGLNLCPQNIRPLQFGINTPLYITNNYDFILKLIGTVLQILIMKSEPKGVGCIVVFQFTRLQHRDVNSSD